MKPKSLHDRPLSPITPGQPPLPPWLQPRDYQLDAVERIVKEFARGAQVVQLDAPTGTGKTAIGELVRRELEVERGLYVCTTKSLQDQVVRDFEYARVLKGRSNYTPRVEGEMRRTAADAGLTVSCQDCDAGPSGVAVEDQTCSLCSHLEDCPYLVARDQTLAAPLGIINTAYLLAEGNTRRSRFTGQDFIIADEADTLEDQLLGYVELRIGSQVARDLGVDVPKKGSHMTTIRSWLDEDLREAIKTRAKGLGGGLEARRKRTRLERLLEDVDRVIAREDGWVREGGEEDEAGRRGGDALVLKPVKVDDVAERFLWRHGQRWLLMSGTTVSAEMQADALGLDDAGIDWAEVKVESQFAKENRRVVYVPAGNMTRKGQEGGGKEKVLRAVERILEKHLGENILIHTFSYSLAKDIAEHIRAWDGRKKVLSYFTARDRDRALEDFKFAADHGGAVLVAASMDRGIDLPGDLCRVQIIAKVPMASLGSRQVGERLRGPGGEVWYLAGTIRTIMQQCGRAVRSMDDYAVTYIIDQHFSKTLKDGKKMGMWPQWWLDGLETGKVREYV